MKRSIYDRQRSGTLAKQVLPLQKNGPEASSDIELNPASYWFGNSAQA
jgi:hypothetical protein